MRPSRRTATVSSLAGPPSGFCRSRGTRANERFFRSDGPGAAGVDAELDRDVCIVGATRETLLRQPASGTAPEEVGRNASRSVITAEKGLGLASRLRRTLER